MADGSDSGATPWLAFLIGGLIVAVVVLGFFMYGGGHFGAQPSTSSVNLTVHTPKVPAPSNSGG